MHPELARREPDGTNENPVRILAESRSVIDADIVRDFISDLGLDLEHVVRIDLRSDRMNVEIAIPGHGEILNTYFYTAPF